ncbi:MAG: hypothetical protein ABII74_03520 [Elusimicrobiota bacterium]
MFRLKIFLVNWMLLSAVFAAPIFAENNLSDLSWGVRAIGLGGAYAGISDESSAVYWNPAGLTQIFQKELSGSYSAFEGENQEYIFSFVQPTIKLGNFGLSLLSWDLTVTKKIAEKESIVMLGYGKEIFKGFSGGINAKQIKEELAGKSAAGWGMDLGLLYRFGESWKSKVMENLRFGLSLKNVVAPKLDLADKFDRFPFGCQAGLSYGVGGRLPNDQLILSIDWQKNSGDSTKLYYGLEYPLSNFLKLRLGFNEEEINTGIGLEGGSLSLGYSLATRSRRQDLILSHHFGLTVRFGQEIFSSRQAKEKKFIEYYLKGIKYVYEKKYGRAVLEFNKILKIDPTYTSALRALNQANQELKKQSAK